MMAKPAICRQARSLEQMASGAGGAVGKRGADDALSATVAGVTPKVGTPHLAQDVLFFTSRGHMPGLARRCLEASGSIM